MFCFSSSTGNNNNQISLEDFKMRIDSVQPTLEDRVVFNGGEPTIHPDFYSMVNYVSENYDTNIVVYTNGVLIDLAQISRSDNLSFVVPIHGEEEMHNKVTRNVNSFKSTIDHLQKFSQNDISFAIKFIINSAMIDSHMDLEDFLDKYALCPCEIVIARLNETKKSKENKFRVPKPSLFIEYLNFVDKRLRDKYVTKYLDIPFCYIQDFEIDNIDDLKVPQFHFNDYQYKMLPRNYYKQIKVGKHCSNCGYSKKCDILTETYLTICYRNKWLLAIE